VQSMRQMTLAQMFGHEEEHVAEHVAEHGSELEVFDLYCGAGGFSTGARDAGCRVVFACDSSEEAIETHRQNHPQTNHWCTKLPRNDIPFPSDGRAFHVHGSPPCQQFSQMNQNGRSEAGLVSAKDQLEWYIDTAIASGATSWSMENVSQSYVISIVKRKRLQHNRVFSYAVINFEKLGVPQSRIRLIAGSHELIAKLLRATEEQPRRSIRSVIASPRGTHIRGSATGVEKRKKARALPGEAQYTYSRASWTDMCRTLDMPAPTVVGRHALTWITGDGEKCNRSVLYPRELAALQTFPVGYKFPQNKFFAYLQIGNALPPLVAQIMLTNRWSHEPDTPSRLWCPCVTLDD